MAVAPERPKVSGGGLVEGYASASKTTKINQIDCNIIIVEETKWWCVVLIVHETAFDIE